jgi:hypothetical protein
MADRVAQLMDERLAVGGRGLQAKLHRGGGRLPRRVRDAALTLAKAAHKARNPKLIGQIDHGLVADAYDICVRHLTTIDPALRRRRIIASILSSVAFATLSAVLLVVGFLAWRGYS